MSRAVADLERAEEIASELHAGCCQPLRSPRMEKLAETVRQAHEEMAKLSEGPDSPSRVVALLEDAGGQLGFLQVACCSPARLELYAEALLKLGTVQRVVTRAHDLEH